MKIKRIFALIFAFSTPLNINVPVHAADTLTLVAEDSFEYTGNIVGKNGGTGFTNAWTSHYGVSDYGMNASGLTYTGLTTAGGYMYGCTATPNTVCGVSREIPLQNSGVIFIQFLANFGSQTGGGTPMLRIFDASGSLTGGIGANGGTYGSNVSILDATGNPPSDGSASAGTLNSNSFYIVRIDYTNNITSMWINPTMATFSYTSPPAATVTLNGLAPVVKNLAFYSRNGYSKFDELKVYKLTTNNSSSSDSDAQAREAERQRQEKIRAAREEIVKKAKSNQSIAALDLTSADLGVRKGSSIDLINKGISNLTDSQKSDFSAINKVIAKYQKYEILGSENPKPLLAKELINVGILPPETPQPNYILSRIQALPSDQRDTVEKVAQLVKEKTDEYNARKAHLAAVLKRG